MHVACLSPSRSSEWLRAGVELLDRRVRGQLGEAQPAVQSALLDRGDVGGEKVVRGPRVAGLGFSAVSSVGASLSAAALDAELLYPPQTDILQTEVDVAIRVREVIFDRGLAGVERPDDIRAFVTSRRSATRPTRRRRNRSRVDLCVVDLTRLRRSAPTLSWPRPRVLFVNGQTTDETLTAAKRVSRALGLRATIMPRRGELQLQAADGDATPVSMVAADPSGVHMTRAASMAQTVEDLDTGRLAPTGAMKEIEAIPRTPPLPTWQFALAAAAGRPRWP